MQNNLQYLAQLYKIREMNIALKLLEATIIGYKVRVFSSQNSAVAPPSDVFGLHTFNSEGHNCYDEPSTVMMNQVRNL